ncbi:hypothetical protein CK203_104110 [Vitis vinifera]|uniref:Uncharacterized protein n=1 Tax=Vitis vinifera TaxID=29760 RepID=A0A438F771_VITVI|nr:hypothetical protein CK203_104110 [Vitis vinifera]
MFGSILEVTGTLMSEESPIIEDHYSPKLGNPLGCRGSTCVEVMITLHGNTISLRRHADGCVPSEGYCHSTIVTPVTIIEDPRSHMDKLERRIKQMRDPDEIISWDDPDDVPVATLPISFRMPDIERYMGVGCPRIHLRLYSIVMRALELEFLGQRSDESVSSFISRWREKAAEMIERPKKNQMCMFLGVCILDDGISRGLWSDIPHSLDIKGKRVVGSSESYGGRPQISIPRHAAVPTPYQRHWMIYFDLGMPLDITFEQLRASYLVPLAPGHSQSTLPPFSCSRFCAFHQMAGHRTDYCTSLCHTIMDLIDSVPPLSGLYHHVLDTQGTDIHRTLDIADLVGVFWDYFAMGFLPISPRVLQILSFTDIVDSGTFGHPQSDMFFIPTLAQAMRADTLSPAVPDLIDLGD